MLPARQEERGAGDAELGLLLTILCGATFFPASLTAVLRSGPFAYDGLIGFWVPYPAWLIWMFVAAYYLVGDLNRRVGAERVALGAALPAK